MKKLFVILSSLLMLCSCAETGTTQENPETNIYNVNYGKDVPELYVGVESWGNSDPAAKDGYEWNEDNGDGTYSVKIRIDDYRFEGYTEYGLAVIVEPDANSPFGYVIKDVIDCELPRG